MKDIDQFIDEVLFKESDQYKLIYETVLELTEADQKFISRHTSAILKKRDEEDAARRARIDAELEKQRAIAKALFNDIKKTKSKIQKNKPEQEEKVCGIVRVPTDIGIAAEFSLIISIKKFLNNKNSSETAENYKIPSIKFNGQDTTEDCIEGALDIFFKNVSDKEDLHKETYNFVQNNIDDWSLKNQIDIKKIDFLDLVGLNQSERIGGRLYYRTTADVYVSSNGIKKGISVKRGSDYFYRGGSVRPSQEFLPDQPIKDIYQSAGGGYKKLYYIFGLNTKVVDEYFEEKTFSDAEIWSSILIEDFCNQANKIYINPKSVHLYFEKIKNLISRYDEKVFLLADISDPKKILYPQLLDKFISHIGKVTHKKGSEARIISFVEDVKPFQFKDINTSDLESTQAQTIEKLINKNTDESKKFFNEFLSDIKSLKQEEIPEDLKIFINDYNEAVTEFEKIVNKALTDIKSDPKIIFIKAETYSGKKQIRIGSFSGLFSIGKLNEIFFFLSTNKKFKNLENCFLSLLEISEKLLNTSKYKENLKESLFETLILEALNEKEFNKIINKVSSAGAEGFISAIPSNKTSNSIAVRFDDDEKINAGIKRIKSKLKSSGYELEDKRVLKFDQDRDTTDVIKNGEVVGRLFFRADIKERQGLAYEHIIGSVLTGKITDQLKNRIDLPPEASAKDVNEKLNSEKFKPLFDSAKKAAPIIEKKVGKIVKAESVGSTNNKADFVLTTADGKVIGLSAKYAAGEKDNEYKMNKVLGFGTEDESLVYNPKAIPWWVVGRQTFLEKLKSGTGAFKDKSYDPDYETLDAPAWMKSAKEKHPDIYKETMEEVYGQIRNILTRNLRRMKFKDLVSFVMEADLGKEEERGNYDKFIKVMDGPSGLSVTELDLNGGDIDGIDPRQLDPEQVVVQDRSDIIIKIPGFDELKINSVKFKSDMLSSKAGDLKIKTR